MQTPAIIARQSAAIAAESLAKLANDRFLVVCDATGYNLEEPTFRQGRPDRQVILAARELHAAEAAHGAASKRLARGHDIALAWIGSREPTATAIATAARCRTNPARENLAGIWQSIWHCSTAKRWAWRRIEQIRRSA